MNNHRNRVATFQSRLNYILDNQRRKLIDGTTLHLISQPVDCIRIRERKNFEGDTTAWVVEDVSIISAVFPELVDVPYRKINVDPETRIWSLTSLVSAFEDDAQDKFYSLQIPFEFDVNVGDVLIRIMQDEAQHYKIVIIMQIQELIGTFGFHKIILQKCKCTIPTFQLPDDIIATVGKMIDRRVTLRY